MHLSTLLDLSEQVANELKNDGLTAHKVNLKIKTIDFQVFTRTKTLENYADCSKQIYEAVKYLLLNEWKNSNKKLRLRLIGVRVSDLKEKQLIVVQKKNDIDQFFKKKIFPNNDDYDEEIEFSFYSNLNMYCRYCESFIEGNHDFLIQHNDICLN